VTQKLLISRQAWWLELLICFDYPIVYWLSWSNGKTDALVVRLGDLPDWWDKRLMIMQQVVPKLQNQPVQLHLLTDSLPTNSNPSIPILVPEAYVTGPLPRKILEAIRIHGWLKEITIVECLEAEERMQYRGNVYVLESDKLNRQLIQGHPDTSLIGHSGQAETVSIIDSMYYWKAM